MHMQKNKFWLKFIQPLLIAALSLLIVPSTASAANDTYITTVEIAEQGSTVAGATTNYTLALVVGTTIPSGTTISVFPTSNSGSPVESGFTLTADFDSAINGTGGTDETQTVFELFLNAELTTGKHALTLQNVVNSSTEDAYFWKATTESLPPTNVTLSESFNIGAGSGDEETANPFTSLSVTPSSTATEEAVSYEIEFMTNADTAPGQVFSFFLQDANSPAGPSNFDFSAAEFSSNTVNATLSTGEPANSAVLTASSKIEAGTHIFTLNPVTNEAIAGTYQAVIAMGEPGESADITLSDANFTLEEAVATTPEAPTGLKAKNVKRRSASLRWGAADNADTYKLRLDRKKGSKYKKVKVFKNITGLKKKVGKKYLKAGKAYRFRVKACNEVGCSVWSAQKKFRTKPAS